MYVMRDAEYEALKGVLAILQSNQPITDSVRALLVQSLDTALDLAMRVQEPEREE
jgi:hypothetical protein